VEESHVLRVAVTRRFLRLLFLQLQVVELGEETKRLQAREVAHNETQAQIHELVHRNDELSVSNSQLRDKLSTALRMLTISTGSGNSPPGHQGHLDVAAFVESCQVFALPAYGLKTVKKEKADVGELLSDLQNQVCSDRLLV
jgi:FtsZ-binding cell division protein ZapB